MLNLQNIPLAAIFSKNQTLKDVDLYLSLAPQNAKPPYIVYSRIAGTALNCLNTQIIAAILSVQIDVYSETLQQTRQIAAQILEALKKIAYLERFNLEECDLSSNLYRTSFDVTFFNTRL